MIRRGDVAVFATLSEVVYSRFAGSHAATSTPEERNGSGAGLVRRTFTVILVGCSWMSGTARLISCRIHLREGRSAMTQQTEARPAMLVGAWSAGSSIGGPGTGSSWCGTALFLRVTRVTPATMGAEHGPRFAAAAAVGPTSTSRAKARRRRESGGRCGSWAGRRSGSVRVAGWLGRPVSTARGSCAGGRTARPGRVCTTSSTFRPPTISPTCSGETGEPCATYVTGPTRP